MGLGLGGPTSPAPSIFGNLFVHRRSRPTVPARDQELH